MRLLGIIVVIGAVICIASAMTPEPVPNSKEYKERQQERQAWSQTYDAKRLVTASLRDPDSAIWGDIVAFDNGTTCGFVNAKNGFGGYTGKQAFIVGYYSSPMFMGSTDYEIERFSETWKRACKNNPVVSAPVVAAPMVVAKPSSSTKATTAVDDRRADRLIEEAKKKDKILRGRQTAQ